MRIIVIEDTSERVEWLRAMTRNQEPEICATASVAKFAELSAQPHDLAVFDYDLCYGDLRFDRDAFGEPRTGLDAALAYTADDRAGALALVWSINEDGARALTAHLRGAGCVVRVVPFRPGRMRDLRVALAGAVAEILTRKARS